MSISFSKSLTGTRPDSILQIASKLILSSYPVCSTVYGYSKVTFIGTGMPIIGLVVKPRFAMLFTQASITPKSLLTLLSVMKEYVPDPKW